MVKSCTTYYNINITCKFRTDCKIESKSHFKFLCIIIEFNILNSYYIIFNIVFIRIYIIPCIFIIVIFFINTFSIFTFSIIIAFFRMIITCCYFNAFRECEGYFSACVNGVCYVFGNDNC